MLAGRPLHIGVRIVANYLAGGADRSGDRFVTPTKGIEVGDKWHIIDKALGRSGPCFSFARLLAESQ